jgi:hypothetical protein
MLILSALLLLLTAATDDKLCGICKTTGRLSLEDLESLKEAEGSVTHCSELIEDAGRHHGIPFYPCPKCKAPSLAAEAREEYEKLRSRKQAWLAEVRKIDEYIDDRRLEISHCATKHFDLVWAIPKMKVGRKTLRQHQAMHLYAERLEDAYAEYLKMFELNHVSDQNGQRHQFLIFGKPAPCHKAMPKYTGIGATNASGAKRLGQPSVMVCWWDKTKNKNDEEFHEFILHNAIHLFITSNHNWKWLARTHGWVDAGVAHYFTQRMFGKSRTHCYQEQDETHRWIHGAWGPEVKKRVLSKSAANFAQTNGKSALIFTAEEHLFSWSWVQFLIENHPAKDFLRFVRLLKDDQPMREALKRIYGYSMFRFPEVWEEYVKKNYSSK